MKFRKKPVEVDAEQFFPDKKPWPEGVEQYTAEVRRNEHGEKSEWFGWRIETLEGTMRVQPKDWIITGIKGERYACKPDIFEQTYEPVLTPSKEA